MKRPAGDVYGEDDEPICATGSVCTLNRDGAVRGRPPREFWIGFAGANPGPSHDDETPRRKPRRQ